MTRAYGSKTKKCHKVVGLVSSVKHLHLVLCLVQVEVGLQAGDDVIQLILLHHMAGLNRLVTNIIVKQIALEDVGELQLLTIVYGHLAGQIDPHQGAIHGVHVEPAVARAATPTGPLD